MKAGRKPRHDKPEKKTLYLAHATIERIERLSGDDKIPYGQFVDKVIEQEECRRKELKKSMRLFATTNGIR